MTWMPVCVGMTGDSEGMATPTLLAHTVIPGLDPEST